MSVHVKQAARLQGYLLHNKLRIVVNRLLRRSRRYRQKAISGVSVASAEQGNQKLYEMLQSGQPLAVIRYGGAEINAYLEGKACMVGLKKQPSQSVCDTTQRQAGFFPNNPMLLVKFAQVVEQTSREIDFLATYATRMENYMVSSFMDKKKLVIADNRAIEPYYFQHQQPWTRALAGKRVLVIHPFADTIEKQYEKRSVLFDDPDILPEFELMTLKAVQTICGTVDERFETWFDALQYMFDEAMKRPFDVAIIGCGAYGQPLACMLKKAGKQAIHIGGGVQILFGIKGKRWELNSKEIPAMFNDYWVRPSEDETPQNKDKNEFGGAYW